MSQELSRHTVQIGDVVTTTTGRKYQWTVSAVDPIAGTVELVRNVGRGRAYTVVPANECNRLASACVVTKLPVKPRYLDPERARSNYAYMLRTAASPSAANVWRKLFEAVA